MDGPKPESWFHKIKDGFVRGLGWSFGVTIGFVIISSVLVTALQAMGGLPLIGAWIASVVETTQAELIKRNPYLR
ncbi:MAG: hypothetical protein UX87_C0016G0021 [Candidatus Amesbacteria bacterium GW2011_GWA1_47_16]|uniref:Uncharacterized protein n=5 Tax=Candidatus Amesiibacteriota TaxID=1752730 RepID=A0A1F4ZXJ8_9BACT|nr:MAG: hypothetical protein UX87_C0016G0021 [Candidatus Amesbacteria bacterium GW2011_GWA1_47_16]KKU64831.1 MAG: hypothetical protein UX86_C0004G0032 [Candidatus Amesbacteria bacterium GW2011_GWC1_47_15]KKU98031.1 MAG: hypothetical protein UY28_C0009G0031 [Candidatus Amesbacteria bacterium GW2011_GWB1_48_13]OGC99401.1 MAG: hypothetical protein A2701_04660 [Candidatus Amesbacteria bacterium RIFCSPHIGHO2_01_FULL_47_34]OGD00847.1 MAG: hypothetical protein A2972_00150 [Candidatus Amesbacteria bact